MAGVHGGGVGVALPFLVEGQQRHVCCLDAHQQLFKITFKRLSKTPKRLSKTSNKPPRPQKDSPRPQKTLQDLKKTLQDLKRPPKTSKRPRKTSKRPPASESAREFMDLPQWGGALVNTPRCPPLIGQVLRPTFLGRGLGPCRETPPLLHAGPHSTSNSINATTAHAEKPQPVFHAGSYLTSNSVNVAQAVVQVLQHLWKERWWKRQ